jgi:WD40-like Beta Propeller Repeat
MNLMNSSHVCALGACIVAAFGLCSGSSSSRAAGGGPEEKLVFVEYGARQGISSGIYVANRDGSGLRRLTRGADEHPAWSPDGGRIAFDRYPRSVFVMPAGGGGLRRIGEGVNPVWSPDGTRIAFHCGNAICVVDLDGTGSTRIAPAFGGFAWSPDGTRIGYGVGYGDCRELILVDVASGSRTILPTTAKEPGRLAWSPDGAHIAFLSADDDKLYVANVSGGAVRQLALARVDYTNEGTPAWSADSKSILFTDKNDLYLIHVNGTTKARVTNTADAGSPSWSPDGRLIAYQRQRVPGVLEAGDDIWVIQPNGAGAAPVTRAFPDGLDYQTPNVTSGSVPAAAVQVSSPTLSLRPSRTLTTGQRILSIAADGARTAFNATDGFDSCIVGVWTPASGAVRHAGGDCGDAYGIGWLALAGYRVAWTYSEQTNTLHEDVLVTTRLGSGRQDDISADNDQDQYLGNLHGHGSLLVFNRWTEPKEGVVLRPQIWQIVGSRKASERLVVSRPDAIRVEDVDAGRIAVYTRDGRIVLLHADGQRIATFRVGRGAVDISLSGSQLSLRRGKTIEVYDVDRGKRVHVRTLRQLSAPLRLVGVQGKVAVYVAGIAIHLLRLADGRDVVLRLGNEAGPADAALEPEGLYYSYNEAYVPQPGRIGFVPRRRLLARLG